MSPLPPFSLRDTVGSMLDIKTVVQFVQRRQLPARLPVISTYLMVVLLAAALAQATWMLVPTPANEARIPAAPVKRPSRTASPMPARLPLARLHLFGDFQAPAVAPVVATPQEVPETRLNLTLMGVLASTDDRNAKAIIADASKNEDFYAVGAAIPGGAQLVEIHEDHVILRRNNQLETLRLPEDVPGGAAGARGSALPTARERPSKNLGANRIDPRASTGELLKDWQGKLNSDPQSLMDLVRAEPVNRDGKLVGYRIRPNKDRTVMRKFGLRPGDIVTGVNGMPLDNPLNGLEILNTLKNASQVNLEVERNGKNQSFTFDVGG